MAEAKGSPVCGCGVVRASGQRESDEEGIDTALCIPRYAVFSTVLNYKAPVTANPCNPSHAMLHAVREADHFLLSCFADMTASLLRVV